MSIKYIDYINLSIMTCQCSNGGITNNGKSGLVTQPPCAPIAFHHTWNVVQPAVNIINITISLYKSSFFIYVYLHIHTPTLIFFYLCIFHTHTLIFFCLCIFHTHTHTHLNLLLFMYISHTHTHPNLLLFMYILHTHTPFPFSSNGRLFNASSACKMTMVTLQAIALAELPITSMFIHRY
jgi:hypothetical protein